MLESIIRFDKDEAANQRMKIIRFYEEYGEKATIEAFGCDRRLISKWRERLKKEGITGLIPKSTRPHKVRRAETPLEVIRFIKDLREKYSRIGKEKIKPLLDEYCRKKGLKTISESTIGNIIKRHKLFFQKTGRVYHNPNSKWANNKRNKTKRLRVKRSVRHEEFGHIISDTVERVTDGVKDYFYSAMDAKLKFALTINYKRHTSKNMKDFYKRFKEVYLFPIKSWQSDNGSENLGEFDEQLKQDGIPHYFSYPNCPKINSYIERYNRTIQEEFIDNNLDAIHDKGEFHKRLADYLIFYNTTRPHKSLGLKSPLGCLIEKGEMSQMSLTYINS